MEKADFEARIKKYESSLAQSAGLYKARLLGFALLGYVVYGFVVLLALGLLLGMGSLLIFHPSVLMVKLGIKAGIPLLLLVFGLFASLKIAPYHPEGIQLKPNEAPELFAVIDELRARLSVPPISRVVLTDDYNASVVQNTRFGFFGTRSILTLGLPLLQALSKDDLRAVLAHELGHLSGNHSRFSGWIYRVVRTYVQLADRVGSSAAIEKFLNWYVPRLDALSFPLRRQNEYEADAAAAELVGAPRAAQALVNVSVRAGELDGFWKNVQDKVIDSPHPPGDLFLWWAQCPTSQSERDAQKALDESLNETTSCTDTHPSLKDRVAALGQVPRIEPFSESSAATVFFGTQETYFAKHVGSHWASQVNEGWQQRHQYLKNRRVRFDQLLAEKENRALSADETFEYADIFEDLNPSEDAAPAFRAVLELDPQHASARFALGRILVGRDDGEGASFLEGLSSHNNPELRMACAALLSDFHERSGQEEEAKKALERAVRAAEEHDAELQAREELRIGDQFVAHELDEKQLANIVETLEVFSEVRRAYLVKKLLPDGGRPIYVLAFDAKHKMLSGEEERAAFPQRLVEAMGFEGELWVLDLENNGKFRPPFSQVESSLIFER